MFFESVSDNRLLLAGRWTTEDERTNEQEEEGSLLEGMDITTVRHLRFFFNLFFIIIVIFFSCFLDLDLLFWKLAVVVLDVPTVFGFLPVVSFFG